jgi:hypothetical protein
MTEKYIVYNTRAEAEAAIAYADSIAGFPNDTSQTCSSIISHNGKFLLVAPDYFPAEWFPSAQRKDALTVGYILPEPPL